MNDTELLDWLAEHDGAALISDDAGRWVVTFEGTQIVPDPDEPTDIASTFWIDADKWQPSVREAILAGIVEVGEPDEVESDVPVEEPAE